MPFLLDSNIVIAFQFAGALDILMKAAVAVPMVLSEIVLGELTDISRSGNPAAKAHMAAVGRTLPGAFRIIRPDAGSAIARTYVLLRGRRGDKKQALQRNSGEDESLAIALHEPDLIYVCHDGEALRAAANELGTDRIMSFHFFLRRLVEAGALPAATADRIARDLEVLKGADTTRDKAYAVPLWWPPWVVERSAADDVGTGGVQR
jgi:predicted nucleic acid-binding protein